MKEYRRTVVLKDGAINVTIYPVRLIHGTKYFFEITRDDESHIFCEVRLGQHTKTWVLISPVSQESMDYEIFLVSMQREMHLTK